MKKNKSNEKNCLVYEKNKIPKRIQQIRITRSLYDKIWKVPLMHYL